MAKLTVRRVEPKTEVLNVELFEEGGRVGLRVEKGEYICGINCDGVLELYNYAVSVDNMLAEGSENAAIRTEEADVDVLFDN